MWLNHVQYRRGDILRHEDILKTAWLLMFKTFFMLNTIEHEIYHVHKY